MSASGRICNHNGISKMAFQDRQRVHEYVWSVKTHIAERIQSNSAVKQKLADFGDDLRLTKCHSHSKAVLLSSLQQTQTHADTESEANLRIFTQHVRLNTGPHRPENVEQQHVIFWPVRASSWRAATPKNSLGAAQHSLAQKLDKLASEFRKPYRKSGNSSKTAYSSNQWCKQDFLFQDQDQDFSRIFVSKSQITHSV